MQQRLRDAAQSVVGEQSVLAVDGVGGKSREADSDVLGAPLEVRWIPLESLVQYSGRTRSH